jgi:hypothetical protein
VSDDRRIWQVERDRFGTMYSGPLEVGEMVEVVELETLLAKLEQMDLCEDTGDASDGGYMWALNEIREWLSIPKKGKT